uniref:NIF system FeS cluster assembly NifU N-terminal domain-containing protein n=1 Tax=Chrysemys picta bellii TaxID=8478 RepID=A0A8C3HMG2_CHRPI
MFCSLQGCSPGSLSDAFLIPWEDHLLYAFPPFPLVHKVLLKLRRDKARLILIAPAGLAPLELAGSTMGNMGSLDKTGKNLWYLISGGSCLWRYNCLKLTAMEWIKGKTVGKDLTIRNFDIAKELCSSPVKLLCSMLAKDEIKVALTDYKLK